MDETRQRTRAEISQEIDLRQRTVNKFQIISGPIRQALNEINRRLTHEKQMIDALAKELKERADE